MAESNSGFSPVETLRLIRQILSDRSLGHAERIATVAVVLCLDNSDGTGWSSYRSIRDGFGLSLDSIARALKVDGGKAIGRYLAIVERGAQNSVRYGALRSAERPGQQSTLRSCGSSAPILRVQRSGQRRQSGSISSPSLLPHCEEEHASQAPEATAARPKVSQIAPDFQKRTWQGITDVDWQAWADTYPAVDVRTEARQALEWCLSAGARGRKSNYRRFLMNWFKRTQDRGGSNQAKARTEAKHQREYTEPAKRLPIIG